MPGSNAASGTAVGTARSTRVVGAAIWMRQNPAPVAPSGPRPPGATVTAVMFLPSAGEPSERPRRGLPCRVTRTAPRTGSPVDEDDIRPGDRRTHVDAAVPAAPAGAPSGGARGRRRAPAAARADARLAGQRLVHRAARAVGVGLGGLPAGRPTQPDHLRRGVVLPGLGAGHGGRVAAVGALAEPRPGAAAALGVPAPPHAHPRPGPAGRAGPAGARAVGRPGPGDAVVGRGVRAALGAAARRRRLRGGPHRRRPPAARRGAGARRSRARSRTSTRCPPPRCGGSSPPTARCPTCRCASRSAGSRPSGCPHRRTPPPPARWCGRCWARPRSSTPRRTCSSRSAPRPGPPGLGVGEVAAARPPPHRARRRGPGAPGRPVAAGPGGLARGRADPAVRVQPARGPADGRAARRGRPRRRRRHRQRADAGPEGCRR